MHRLNIARRRAPTLIAFALCAAAAIATQSVAAPSSASPVKTSGGDINPGAVIAMILNDNPTLRTYRAHAHLDIRQTNFPWLHAVLDGSQFYSQPGYTTYDFPHTPSYLKGITKIQAAVGLATRWSHCYDISVTQNGDAYVLAMTPKIRGEVREMDVTVDRHDGTVHHIDWWYHDVGDYVSFDQYYGLVSGHRVVTLQQSTLVRHHIHAIGNATFDSFQFNVPVPTPTPTPSNPLHACDD
jgi:hypothetical protein